MNIRNNEGKLIVFFDMDGMLINTPKAFCDVWAEMHYDDIFTYNTEIYPKWWEVKKWSFKDAIPNITNDELSSIFESERFFEVVDFYADANGFSMNDLLYELCQDNRLKIKIATKGTRKNLLLKKFFIQKYMPYFDIHDFIGMPADIMDEMEKSELEGWLLLDDNYKNILTSNTKHKLLFSYGGIITDWNDKIMNDINAPKAFTVNEVANKIIELIEFEQLR